MSVGRREVEHVAGLARVPLEPAEADRLRDEMNRILEHADRLRGAAGAGPAADRAGSEDGGTDDAGVGAGPDPDRADASESGMRAPGTVGPDPLVRGIETFAPALEAGFFLVPPPQGVTAGEAG